MSNEIKGTVHAVLPMESGTSQTSGRSWSRQTVVIRWIGGTEEYPKECFLALTNQNRAQEFAKLQVGDKIKARYRVTSREYNGKWYHDVNCFGWEVESSTAPVEPVESHAENAAESLEPQKGDLPF